MHKIAHSFVPSVNSSFPPLQVEATDLDCGENSEVSYRILEQNVDSFRVEGDSGRICLARPLDHERQQSYGFTVLAEDKGEVFRGITTQL